MTVDHDLIRTALDHRIHAAGLHDEAAIPEPHVVSLDLARPSSPAPAARRVLGVAAALAVLGATAAVVATRSDDGPRSTVTRPATTTTAAAPTTTIARPELPPPWPRLEVHPALELPDHEPIETEADFLDVLPELDAQGKAQMEATGRVTLRDDLTGELVSVDALAMGEQYQAAARWYREHIDATVPNVIDAAWIAAKDPVTLFTDGSVRLVYRSDLDCSRRADGTTKAYCLGADGAEALGD